MRDCIRKYLGRFSHPTAIGLWSRLWLAYTRAEASVYNSNVHHADFNAGPAYVGIHKLPTLRRAFSKWMQYENVQIVDLKLNFNVVWLHAWCHRLSSFHCEAYTVCVYSVDQRVEYYHREEVIYSGGLNLIVEGAHPLMTRGRFGGSLTSSPSALA